MQRTVRKSNASRLDEVFERKHHFLDTNLLIAHTVRWDDPAEESMIYLAKTQENNCDLYTSEKVRGEMQRVINKSKQRLKRAMVEIKRNFDYREHRDLLSDLKGFLRSYFDDNLKSIVLNYIELRLDEVEDLIKNPEKLDDKLELIEDDFGKATNFMRALPVGQVEYVNYVKSVPGQYRDVYEKEWAALKDVLNKTDRAVLFDAYHVFIRDHTVDNIVFATLDGDFVRNGAQDEIENCLRGVFVFHFYSAFPN